eukprot:Phypoly_transcript_11952.p1 GENE.Phypoly_transcript_11952~~Phypoly_transcript_11952.p1  ORF type:complete len:345 (+),score=19.92 Phypoly_transcript_11952:80-1114(+)
MKWMEKELGDPLDVIWYNLPSVGLISVAIFVVILGSKRSLATDIFLNQNEEIREGLTLKTSTVILFPIVASCTLLLYFYLWKFVSIIVTFSTLLVAVYALVYLFDPVITVLQIRDRILFRDTSLFGNVTVVNVIMYLLSVTFVFVWLASGHWIFSAVIGVGMCTVFIGYIRVPSLRLLVILLGGLFLYDIFWVFYSSSIFGSNVMEKVATQKSPNPMSAVIPSAPELINLPTSITICGCCSCHSLGLGDMALPGLFVSYIYRYESYKGLGLRLFNVAVAGYGIGLIIAFLFLTMLQVAQPALLYLVPCSILPVSFLGYMRGNLQSLWNGSTEISGPKQDEKREV